MYSVVTVLAAVIAISAADPTTSSPKVCPKPPSAANATLADLAGALMYTRYYNFIGFDPDVDGMAFRLDRQGDPNTYTVTVTKLSYSRSKIEETFTWKEYPTENRLEVLSPSGSINIMYYSIPYLENNISSVLYLCSINDNKITQFTQVFTSNLDSYPTKALEEARKIVGSDLTELPYKLKSAFLV